MKKHLLVFYTLFSVTGFSQEWAPIGATWHYNYNVSTGWFGIPGSGYSVFESIADTVIDGISCRKIQKSKSYEPYSRPNQEYTYYSNDSVFFYDFDSSEFRLLYDFDSSPGEFWYYWFQGNSFTGDIDTIKTVVDSTDIITINAIPLKRLYVHLEPIGFEDDWMFDDITGNYPTQIVEYIGDLSNMISTFIIDGPVADYSCPSGLRCYDDTFIGHYETGIVDSCNYVNLLVTNEFVQSSVIIYPNPVSDQIYIKGNLQEYVIFSMEGHQVLRGEIDQHTIEISDLHAGLYIITVYGPEEKMTFRFCKEN
ncbi:MAG: T9SS type A sorting domain-containing protein [Crocinitomicaceae bacterium]|nr:T9SS type A sorting domain-containing protein [Crocinitomicaceae bacterium]